MNISRYVIEKTAYTNSVCALQRAENLSILGAKNVIELCVGPSMPMLSVAYHKLGIHVTGNDIDPRYKASFPMYNWIIGNCFDVDVSPFDFIVFAPPLSKSCSGKRSDALSFWEVTPGYEEALHTFSGKNICLVLPGKTLSVKEDRKRLYNFLFKLKKYELVPLKNKVTKYLDIYIV